MIERKHSKASKINTMIMTNLNWVEGDAVRLSTKYYYLILANYEFSFVSAKPSTELGKRSKNSNK